MEYALGTDPTKANGSPPVALNLGGTSVGIVYTLDVSKTDIDVELLGSSDLENWYLLPTTPAPVEGVMQTWSINEDRRFFPKQFYALRVTQKPAPMTGIGREMPDQR